MELITDRTHADCERARYLIDKVHAGKTLTEAERAEYFGGLRGAYTMAIDWNRVEAVVRDFSVKMGLGLVTKTNWSYKDIATREEIQRYLGNVAAVYAALDHKAGIPVPPAIDQWINYRTANDIEKIMKRAAMETTGYAILDVSAYLDVYAYLG